MTRTRTPLLHCLLTLLSGIPVICSSSSEAPVISTVKRTITAYQKAPPRLPPTPTPTFPLQGVHHHNTTGLDNTITSTQRDHRRNPQTRDDIQVPRTTLQPTRPVQMNINEANGDGSRRNTSAAAMTVVLVKVVRGDSGTDGEEENKALEERGKDDGRFICPLFSRRVCFVALWALAMTVTLFFGLTVFLLVRLSARRQKLAEEGSPVPRARALDPGNMWAVRKLSLGEQAEFWYASPRTARQRGEATGRTAVREGEKLVRGGRKETIGQEEGSSLWTQPRVTLEDISDFWYSNGRQVIDTGHYTAD
ncbi:unnamed protein product [Merluccius merluccius]